jgi:hypothetical protein
LHFWESLSQINDIVSTAAMAITMKCSEDNHGMPTVIDVQQPFPFRCFCIRFQSPSKTNLYATCLCHSHYPASAAFALLSEVREKCNSSGSGDISGTFHSYKPSGIDGKYMERVQDPKQVDKLQRVQEDLDDLKLIVIDNLQKLTIRGEHLDRMMEQSENLHQVSLQFFQSAKRVHKCCWIF